MLNKKQNLIKEYGLQKGFSEVKFTEENLYLFLRSIKTLHFAFDVYHRYMGGCFVVCGIVYKTMNDVETFQKTLLEYKRTDVWKVFKFYSNICDCEYYRIILED